MVFRRAKERLSSKNRGEWEPNDYVDGTASISCPDCGKIGSLRGHKIANDGTVTPSLVCPSGSCSFHDTEGRLDGWENRYAQQ